MATEEQVRQAMKELGIKEYKNTEKTSPAYKRAEKMLDEADLDKSRIENNKKGMEARLKQYAQNKSAPTVQQNVSDKVGYGTQQDLDNLYNKGEINLPQKSTMAKTGKFADKLKDAYNVAKNSKVAGVAKNAMPVLKGAAKAAGKFVAPIAAITTAGDLYDLYQANKASKNAQNIDEQTRQVFNTFDNLKAQGYDELTAWQIANGLPVSSAAQVDQTVQQPTKSSTKKVDMKQKMQNEVAKDIQNLPQASGNVEQFINNQIAQYGGYDGGASVPPADLASANEQPAVPPQEVVPTQTVDQQGVQPTAQNVQAPSQVDYAQQIMSMTPQGYVSSQDIMDKLNAAYANINQQVNADPRYQGGVVQPNNPYNIDERELARLQRADQYMNAFGVESDLAGQYAQQRQVMYEQQMANQLGVPYQDYIDATLDQRKARIANEAQQMENVLKLQAQQATDMKTRLDAMNKMQELRNNVATEMYKAELDAQTKKDVAMLNAVGGIAKTQAFTNAPSTMLQAAGQYAGNVSTGLGGNYMYSNLWAMTPEQRGMFLNAGKPMSNEELRAFFGRMGNVPVQFRSQDGQMPVQQTQSQGILPSIAQWVLGD